jgi:hypothetical protein
MQLKIVEIGAVKAIVIVFNGATALSGIGPLQYRGITITKGIPNYAV